MEITAPERQIIKSSDRPIYINSANIISSYFDFQFTFCDNSIDLSSHSIESKELVKIVMSPQHAKVLFNMLQEQIKSYESQFGILDTPKVDK